MTNKLFLAVGLLCVLIGFIGIFVPLLPSTPFAILAAYCFEKGSPRMHTWLLQTKGLGPAIRDWEKNKIIRPKIKILAISLIIISLSYPIVFKPIPLWTKIVAGLVGLACISFIGSRKSRV